MAIFEMDILLIPGSPCSDSREYTFLSENNNLATEFECSLSWPQPLPAPPNRALRPPSLRPGYQLCADNL